mmetsp:Transcript_13392/g.24614  ORF Transcript_13392/g.24614 Transcript_13392/m.24614 type:complete len:252 (+) Transcript_13392:1000-1755(+)
MVGLQPISSYGLLLVEDVVGFVAVASELGVDAIDRPNEIFVGGEVSIVRGQSIHDRGDYVDCKAPVEACESHVLCLQVEHLDRRGIESVDVNSGNLAGEILAVEVRHKVCVVFVGKAADETTEVVVDSSQVEDIDGREVRISTDILINEPCVAVRIGFSGLDRPEPSELLVLNPVVPHGNVELTDGQPDGLTVVFSPVKEGHYEAIAGCAGKGREAVLVPREVVVDVLEAFDDDLVLLIFACGLHVGVYTV